MTIYISIIKILALILSLAGYYWIFRRRLNLRQEFCPVVILCSIGMIVFIAGILNMMKLALYGILIVGLIAFLEELIIGIKHYSLSGCIKKVISDITPGMVFFIILCIYMSIWLHDSKFYIYDNFSHWGTIVKNLMYDNQFPTSADSIIIFQTYPLGIPALLWFFLKFTGYSEGMAMFFEAAFLASCVLPLFAFIKSKKRIIIVISCIIAAFACICAVTFGGKEANGLFNLLVDDVLGLIPIAAYAIIVFYRDQIKRAVLFVLPLSAFVITVKSSGMIWVLVIAALIVFYAHFAGSGKMTTAVYTGISLAAPLLVNLIWNAHVDYVFDASENTAHAVSISRYAEMLAEKSTDDIKGIAAKFLKEVFSFGNLFWIVLLAMVFIVIIFVVKNRSVIKEYHLLFSLIFITVVYTVYQAGNFLMYIFSMRLEEAAELLCYDRYAMTVELFVWGMVLILILQLMQRIELNRKHCSDIITTTLCFVLSGILLYSRSGEISKLFIREDSNRVQTALRTRLEYLIGENGLAENTGKKYMIYEHGPLVGDGGYRWFVSRYLLYAITTDVLVTEDIVGMGVMPLAYYDNILAITKDEEFSKWLYRNNLPDVDFIDVSELSYITLSEYLSNVDYENSLVIISANGDASYSFSEENAESFRQIGLKYNMLDSYGQSYLAVIDSGKVVFENKNIEEIVYNGEVNSVFVAASSAGYGCGSSSSIVINDTEYSRNGIGLNIVVYDHSTQSVISSMNFDTNVLDGAYYKE